MSSKDPPSILEISEVANYSQEVDVLMQASQAPIMEED